MEIKSIAWAILVAIATQSSNAEAKIQRSASAKAEFKRLSPCPATGQRRGTCPGYVIDHVVPLCAGGPDRSDNMQWQTVDDGKRKDREERRMCQRSRG